MFQKVDEARFIEGEHEMLRLWRERDVFRQLLEKNAGGPRWSFLDGPITANNAMGVHHAWGRTYKDAFQRYFAMTGHELRYQNGFDCQGLWVEVEVEKELGLGTKTAIVEQGIDKFVRACKQRVLRFAARQTEQSVRLGYWMDWDDPDELRKLAESIGSDADLSFRTPKAGTVTGKAEELTARLGNPEWGGSYFTFSTENNETIWTFLKKCFERGKIYLGHDVMPWGGRAGSAYSQMEIADGRKLTTHRSCFVRFPIISKPNQSPPATSGGSDAGEDPGAQGDSYPRGVARGLDEYLLVWTTTPWTLTSNVAAAVNPDLEYVRVKAQIRGDEEPAYYYFAKENLDCKRLEREFKEGFGRPEWQWPDGLGKLKTIAQIFKEQGGYEIDGTIKGADIPAGARKITIKKTGPGALYYSAQLKYFTKEGEIKGAGSQIAVTRKYYKLTPKHEARKVKNAKGREIEIEELKWARTELAMGAVLKSGDQLEVELTIKAPNDYEYIVIEDLKLAGCQPVALVSGNRYGAGRCSNM